MTAEDIEVALRKRYAPPEWAFLAQVANGTGANGTRTADALAINLWPSRGNALHGFEIRVSRSDWLTELKKPEKAEAIAKFCDFWWIAAPDVDIVRPAELPSVWGLLIVNDGVVTKIAKEAEKLQAQPLTRAFVSSVLRQANKQSMYEKAIKAAVDQAVEVERKRQDERAAQNNSLAQAEAKSLRELVRVFQESSGVDLSKSWSIGRIGDIVKLVLAADGAAEIANRIESNAEILDRSLVRMRDAARELRLTLK